MDQNDAIWLSALFETGGHIGWVGKNSVRLSVSSHSRDVIERVSTITETGTIGTQDLGQPVYTWRVANKSDVSQILTAMLPYFGARRRKTTIKALQRLKKVRVYGECQEGHPMSGKNLYVSPRGHRQCRKCARLRDDMRSRGVPSGMSSEQTEPDEISDSGRFL